MCKQLPTWLPAVLLLTLLPGCPVLDWFKEQFGFKKPHVENGATNGAREAGQAEEPQGDAKSAVILADGKVAVSKQDFEENLEAMKQSQPEIQQVLALTPEDQQKQLYKQIADMLANQYVLMRYVKEQGLDLSEEYQKNRRLLMDQMEKTLASQTFQSHLYEELEGEISDKEARTYYEQNKATMAMYQPDVFLKKSGGVKASVVQADNQEQAQKIAEAARESDLKKAARDFDKSNAVNDLGTVTQQSKSPNQEVVSKIVNMQNEQLPQVDTSGSYVIYATEKVEPKYADYKDVESQVKNYILSERLQRYYNEKISQLRERYGVTTNEEALKAFVTPQAGGAEEAQNGNAQ